MDPGDDIMGDLCQLACQYSNFDLCYIQERPGTPIHNASKVFAMNWRFFPTLDPQVICIFIEKFTLQRSTWPQFDASMFVLFFKYPVSLT